MNARQEIRCELPPLLMPFDEPKPRRRYYVAFGGRGSGKSWSVARVLLMQAMRDPLRIMCVREIQRTIADSVHALLKRQVEELGVGWFFNVQETNISGLNGADISFAGLRNIDAAKIKSFEGADLAWVEEAQVVTKRSWEVLIPTIREPGSEIWATFNPELDTDDTYTRFVGSEDTDTWVQKVTWADNPWFPEVLERERVKLKARDPVEYEHVWEGKPRTVVEGAIYAREMTAMIEDGRVCALPYDPKLPVHTIWDLGWNDQTSIVFAQRQLSQVALIDYEEESFLRYDEWAKRLLLKPYIYASHWLPHDGGSATIGSKGLSGQDILKPLLRMKPKLIPRPASKEVPIKAARMMFPRVYMDRVKTMRLQNCLKRFRRIVPEETGEPRAPLHDEYSHGADAFGGLALIVDKLSNVPDQPETTHEPWVPADPGMGR